MRSNPLFYLDKILSYVSNEKNNAEQNITSLETEYVSGMVYKNQFIEFCGEMAKLTGVRGFYSQDGIYCTKDRYLVGCYPKTSTDYEIEQIMFLKNYCDGLGVNLLYVNYPTKYMDDNLAMSEFGMDSYVNRNADLLIERMQDKGISVIDLRDNIVNESKDIKQMFYRTDHHWTVESGFWASKIIAEGLNNYCGYNIDTSIYDDNNFSFERLEDCWLGEQGQKVSESYIGLDNFTVIKPIFETSYLIPFEGELLPRTFDRFVDDSNYDFTKDVHDIGSLHYSYYPIHSINTDVEFGKVLVLGDSFNNVVVPFLSLSIHEVDPIILRGMEDDFDLLNYIKEGNYDTVIVSYVETEIGAHDAGSWNGKLFEFAKN